MNTDSSQNESNEFITVQRKRLPGESGSDESKNASKFLKIELNFWIYLESENKNLAKYALKHPKTFEQDFKAATKISNLKAEDVKFFLAKGIIRVKCKNEKQQQDLSTIKKIGDIQVTASLPWALSQNENAVNQNRAKKPVEFKYVISGVATEITENEIKGAVDCKEVIRINKLENKNLVQTQTCILTFENEIELPKTVAIGFIKFKLRAYVPGPLRCKNCLQYGHTSKNCSHKPRCLHCGKLGHNLNNCENQNETEVRCANCTGEHTADDKSCPKYKQVRDRLRREDADRRQTYSRALVGVTNTVAAAAAGVHDEVTQITNKQQIDIKTEIKNGLIEFTTEFTADIGKILREYTNEIKNIKSKISAEMEISEQKINQLEVALATQIDENQTLTARVDKLVQEQTETEKKLKTIDTAIANAFKAQAAQIELLRNRLTTLEPKNTSSNNTQS